MRQKNLRGLGSFCLTSTSRYTNTCTFEAVVLRGGRVCHESQESRRRLGCLMYPPLLFTTESYLSLTWLVCGDTSSHVSPLTFHHWVLLEFHMACMRWYVLTCIPPYFSPPSPTWVWHGLYAVICPHMNTPLLFTTESYLSWHGLYAMMSRWLNSIAGRQVWLGAGLVPKVPQVQQVLC
jgi:hypothetical protein